MCDFLTVPKDWAVGGLIKGSASAKETLILDLPPFRVLDEVKKPKPTYTFSDHLALKLDHPTIKSLRTEGWRILGYTEQDGETMTLLYWPNTTMSGASLPEMWREFAVPSTPSPEADADTGDAAVAMKRFGEAIKEAKEKGYLDNLPKTIREETKEQFDAHFDEVFKSWAESNHLTDGIETQMLRVMAKNFYERGFSKAARIAINRTQHHWQDMTQITSGESGRW